MIIFNDWNGHWWELTFEPNKVRSARKWFSSEDEKDEKDRGSLLWRMDSASVRKPYKGKAKGKSVADALHHLLVWSILDTVIRT